MNTGEKDGKTTGDKSFEARCFVHQDELDVPEQHSAEAIQHRHFRKTLAEAAKELEYWIAVAEYAKQTILIPYSLRTAAQYHWVVAKQRSWKEAADHFKRLMGTAPNLQKNGGLGGSESSGSSSRDPST